MKVLCSSVLGIEAVVVFLASLVASTNGSVGSQGLAIGLGAALAIVLFLSIGVLRRAGARPYGIWWGSILQVVVVGIGVLVPTMFVVGGIFAVLWIVAVRTGSRVDAMREAHQAHPDPSLS